MAHNNHSENFIPLGIAVLIISDSRDDESDLSGALLAEKIISGGHRLIDKTIIVDEKDEIINATKKFCSDKDIDVVIASGGTGLAERDVSFEAFSAIYEKEITGFGFAFHNVSEKTVGLSAVLSRASAGLVSGRLVFSLPGSPSACRDAWDEILIHLLDSSYKPCNLAQILNRTA